MARGATESWSEPAGFELDIRLFHRHGTSSRDGKRRDLGMPLRADIDPAEMVPFPMHGASSIAWSAPARRRCAGAIRPAGRSARTFTAPRVQHARRPPYEQVILLPLSDDGEHVNVVMPMRITS